MWNRLLTAVTIPFDPPKSGEVAVKIIDKARDGDDESDQHRKGKVNMERSKNYGTRCRTHRIKQRTGSYPSSVPEPNNRKADWNNKPDKCRPG